METNVITFSIFLNIIIRLYVCGYAGVAFNVLTIQFHWSKECVTYVCAGRIIHLETYFNFIFKSFKMFQRERIEKKKRNDNDINNVYYASIHQFRALSWFHSIIIVNFLTLNPSLYIKECMCRFELFSFLNCLYRA